MSTESVPLRGKVIAITGGASGIGAATATLLAGKGALLSLADTNEASLTALAGKLTTAHSAKIMTTVLDVRDTAAVDDWIESTVKAFGRLDGAFNSAGVGGKVEAGGGPLFRSVVETTDDGYDFVMDINIGGTFKCCRAQARAMLKKGDGWTSGSIVNVSSTAGLLAFPMASPYCMSKHAVIGLSKTLAAELGPSGIRVNAVAPGVISTPLTSGTEQIAAFFEKVAATAPLRRMADPMEVAKAVAFLLSEDASFITGVTYQIDGGFVSGRS